MSLTMPPARGTKRKSDCSSVPGPTHQRPAKGAETTSPTHCASPVAKSSPNKRRKVGVSAAQKQALLDNLQLEITERARKLRANYHVHAQTLRTRVEIRVNRIPLALRKIRMEDLLRRHLADRHRALATVTGMAERPPPVPQKDSVASPPLPRAAADTARGLPTQTAQRPLAASGDKENGGDDADGAKKHRRADRPNEAGREPGHVLSPTSSNTRIHPQDRGVFSLGKTMMARPASPAKPVGASVMLSHFVDKARSTRATVTARQVAHASADAQSSAAGAMAPRSRKGGLAAVPSGRTGAPWGARTASGASESSDGSTSTLVRKGTASRAAAPKPTTATARRTVMSTIKKGVAGAGTTRKAGTVKGPSTTTTSTGRVLRKRG